MKFLVISFAVLFSNLSFAKFSFSLDYPTTNPKFQMIDVSDKSIAADSFHAPEGISMKSDGTLFVANHKKATISILDKLFKPKGTIRFNNLPGWIDGESQVMGIQADKSNNLYIALVNYQGGALVKVNTESYENSIPKVLLRDLGYVNSVHLDESNDRLFISVSDNGEIYHLDLKNGDVNIIEGLIFPNGMAQGKEADWLYISQTMESNIIRINLKDTSIREIVWVGGNAFNSWPDGLTYSKEHDMFLVADNRSGSILSITPSGELIKQVKIFGKEGKSAPASLIIQDGNVLFTDLWVADMPLVLIKDYLDGVKYKKNAYKIPLTNFLLLSKSELN